MYCKKSYKVVRFDWKVVYIMAITKSANVTARIQPEIKEIHYENDELTIIAPDRPEKSIIIGKGGWVVGKLREQLHVKSIHVISYTDIVLKKYQLE